MYKKYLAPLLMLGIGAVISSRVNAEPLKFLDVHWVMSIEQMKTVFSDKGYQCQLTDSNEVICMKDKAKVTIFLEENYLRFNCETFNGCNLTIQRFGSMVEKKLKVELMVETINFFGTLIHKYCGEGKDGDRICLGKTIPSGEVYADLLKGSIGDKVKF